MDNKTPRNIYSKLSICSSNRKVYSYLTLDDEIKLGIIKHLAEIMQVLRMEKR